jgi:hypothetical protein
MCVGRVAWQSRVIETSVEFDVFSVVGRWTSGHVTRYVFVAESSD